MRLRRLGSNTNWSCVLICILVWDPIIWVLTVLWVHYVKSRTLMYSHVSLTKPNCSLLVMYDGYVWHTAQTKQRQLYSMRFLVMSHQSYDRKTVSYDYGQNAIAMKNHKTAHSPYVNSARFFTYLHIRHWAYSIWKKLIKCDQCIMWKWSRPND